MSDKHIPESLLYEYLDGELEASARGTVERHLNSCQICNLELEKSRLLFSTIEAVQDLNVPRNFVPQIMNSIKQESFMSRQWHLALAVQLLLSGALILISWPSMNASLTKLKIPTMDLDIEPYFSNIAHLAQTWRGEIVQNLFGFFERLRVSPQFLPDEIAAIIWPLVISASMLWMVGNGFLLQNGSMKKR